MASVATFAQEAAPSSSAPKTKQQRRSEWMQQFLTGGEQPDPQRQVRAHEEMNARREQAAQREGREALPGAVDPQWVPVGPAPSRDGHGAGGSYDRNSGRVSAVAVDPRDKNVVYAGAASGGVWKSTNGGQSWRALTDTQAVLATGVIALDPSNPNIIYVGTGENKSSGYWGAGILKSTNGGDTWTLVGQQLASGDRFIGGIPAIGSIAVSPDGSRILASVNNSMNTSGVYLSTDGGSTWTKKLGQGFNRPYDVVFANATKAYAGLNSEGIFVSNDAGETWTKISANLGTGIGTNRIELAVSKQDPNVLYALVEHNSGAPKLSVVYKTTNGGQTWTASENLPDVCGWQCFWDMDIAISPTDHNLVWVAGSAGLYNLARSTDGGVTWTDQRTDKVHVDQQALAFSADGTRLYLGNDGGMYSTDTVSGTPVVWNNLNTDLQTTQMYRGFDMHPTDPSVMMVGSQDNGTHYWRGGSDWFHAACGDGAGAVISQTNPTESYAGCQLGEINKSASSRKSTWFSISSRPGDAEHAHFIPLWVGDPSDGDTVYYVTHRLWQTRNAAQTWNVITDSIAGGPTLGTMYALAVCRANTDVVFVGSTTGTLKKLVGTKTTAPGTVLPFIEAGSGITTTRPITSISIHDEDCNQLAAASGGFTGPRVWRSNNGGASWTNMTGDLPEVSVYAVVLDPDVPDTLYVSTSLTVYVTRNGGVNWSPLGYGLPNAIGVDMKLHRPARLLRLVTHGRGVWDAYLPVTREGAYLLASPGSVQFSDQGLEQLSRRSQRTVVLTNQGSAAAQLGSIEIPNEYTVERSGCPDTLDAGQSCSLRVAFAPLDHGFAAGAITVAYNHPQSPAKIFVQGYAGRPVSNDSRDNPKIIPFVPYRDKMDTRLATWDRFDPATGCPATSNNSVWYRYTAQASGPVRVSTIGSDYSTVISVYVGTANPFTRINCAFNPAAIDWPTNSMTFEATAGTTYSFMVSSQRGGGGNLVLSVDWPDDLDFRPAQVDFFMQTGSAAASRRFEIHNLSRTQSMQISELQVAAPFGVQHDCSTVTPMAVCRGQVTFSSTQQAATYQAELTFRSSLSAAAFRIPVRAVVATASLTLRESRGTRSRIAITAGQASKQELVFESSSTEQAFEVVCEASAGLSCELPQSRFVTASDGSLAVAFTLNSSAKPRARRLQTVTNGTVTLKLKDGTVIYSSPVSIRR